MIAESVVIAFNAVVSAATDLVGGSTGVRTLGLEFELSDEKLKEFCDRSSMTLMAIEGGGRSQCLIDLEFSLRTKYFAGTTNRPPKNKSKIGFDAQQVGYRERPCVA